MKKIDVVTKKDWKNLRIGYTKEQVIELVDKKMGYKDDMEKE